MYREHVAVLIGGMVVLALRMGDILLKWVAKKLGVEEIPEKPKSRQKPRKHPQPPAKRDTNDTE